MNIEKMVNDFLAKKKIEGDELHSEFTGLINASSLGQCRRRIYYAIEKFPPTNPPDERTLRVWSAGDLFHQFVQDIALLGVEETALIEQSYKDDVVSVRVDMLTENEVYEFKSMHSHKFWHIQKELEKGKSIFDFQIDHVLQVGLGAKVFNKPIANLVYISKDDLCIKQFVLNAKEIIPLVDQELAEITEMLNIGLLPPPKPRLYGDKIDPKLKCPQECGYCAWREMCFNEQQQREENDRTDQG